MIGPLLRDSRFVFRFSVAEAMVIVAGVAMGLGIARHGGMTGLVLWAGLIPATLCVARRVRQRREAGKTLSPVEAVWIAGCVGLSGSCAAGFGWYVATLVSSPVRVWSVLRPMSGSMIGPAPWLDVVADCVAVVAFLASYAPVLAVLRTRWP